MCVAYATDRLDHPEASAFLLHPQRLRPASRGPLVGRIDRVVVGALVMVGSAVLVVAGAPKVVGPPRAAMLPAWAWRPTGAIELVIGAWGLLAPEAGGAWAAAALYAALSTATLVALVRGVPDCGCFGSAPAPPDPWHLGLDALFAVSCALGAWRGWSLPEPAGTAAAAVAVALVAGVAVVRLLERPRPSRRR
jgi:hypothetical protein